LGLLVLGDTSVTARTVKANPPISSTLAQNLSVPMSKFPVLPK
jgi:hypothetical protein